MASNGKQPQQKRSGDTKGFDLNPLKLPPDLNRRQEGWTNDEALIDDDALPSDPPRQPTSAIRYRQPIGNMRGTREQENDPETGMTRQQIPLSPRRTSQAYDTFPNPVRVRAGRNTNLDISPPQHTRNGRSMHWLLYVGVGMIAALALWVTFSSLLAWGIGKYDDVVYGYPRISETDAVVGHNDSTAHPSHFIAQNLHGQVIVIELPGGDPTKSLDYIGPNLIANGDDLIPITLSFSDVHHNGRPDMIIHIQDREVIFCNTGTKFVSCSTP